MKQVRIEFQQKTKVWQASSDTLIAKWQEELKKYEKERTSLSVKEKQLKEELLLNKQQQINGYR